MMVSLIVRIQRAGATLSSASRAFEIALASGSDLYLYAVGLINEEPPKLMNY